MSANKKTKVIKQRSFAALAANIRHAGPMKDRRLKRKNRNSWRKDIE